MPKGGMAQVVSQADRFSQVFVDAQGFCQSASDLSDLKGMGQPCAKIIAFVIDEHLGLVLQAPEGCRVQDAVPVALEGRPVTRLFVWILAAFGTLTAKSIWGERLIFNLFKTFSGMNHRLILARKKWVISLMQERSNVNLIKFDPYEL
jgi:hypothetical protein